MRAAQVTNKGFTVVFYIRASPWVLWLLLGAKAVVIPQSAAAAGTVAVRANDFLDSIGTLSAISVRGESFQRTVECAKYLGVHWLRAGIEGNVPMQQYIDLHHQTGVRFSWGLGSGSSDLDKLIATGRQLAAAGALLAFEGPNEPNNWGITYQNETGGKTGAGCR